MEFVVLLIVMLNHNDGTAAMRALPAPNHQVCEEARRVFLDGIGPVPEGVEVRARCISTEQLVPSI